MKSAKAVVNGQGTKMARLAVLSFVTWTVVNLSMGTAVYAAAEPFKLWKLDEEGVAGEKITKIDRQDKKDVASLVAKKDFKQVVETLHVEPTHLLEGLRQAILTQKDDAAKEAVKKSLHDEFAKVEAKFFGGSKRKEAFLKLIEKLAKFSIKELAEFTEEEFIQALLEGEEDLLKALALTEVKPEKGPKKDENNGGNNNDGDREVVDTRVGEQVEDNFDAFRQAEATGKQVCDRAEAIRAEQRAADERNRNVLKEQLNRIAALAAAPQAAQQQQKQDDGLGIQELLKGLVQDDQQQQVVPPQQPQLASTAPTQEEPERNSALDQGIPPAPTPAPPSPSPYFGTPSSNGQRPQIALDLPTVDGSRELRSAQDALSMAEDVLAKGSPQLMNPYTGQPIHPLQAAAQLGAQKSEVEGALANVNQSIKSANTRLTQMDSDLQKLKDGGRAALPAWVGKEQTRLQLAFDEKKKNFENQRQALSQQAQSNPDLQAQLATQLGGMSQEMQQVENELKQFNAEVESMVEKGNKEIAALKSRKESLETYVSDLKSRKTTLDAKKTEVDQALMSNAQNMLAMQQPQVGGTTNVNRLRGTQPVQRGSAPGNALTGTTPTGVRGALGGNNI